MSSEVRSLAELLPNVSSLRVPARARLSAADRVKQEAHEAGYAAGYDIGYVEGREEGRKQAYGEGSEAAAAEVRRIASELDSIGQEIHEAVARWYEGAEASLAALSIEIARRLVAKELELSEEAILGITREALGEVTHAASARIRVNPMHSGVLEAHREQILSIAPSLKHVEIVGDDTIGGGCVVETEGGVVDAAIESKLDVLVRAARRTGLTASSSSQRRAA